MKMSITRALVKIKTLDAKIANDLSSLKPAVAACNNDTNFDVADFKKRQSALLDSIRDNVTLRNRIKRALVLANANTKVTVGGVEMTVAEAIEMRDSSIDIKQKYRNIIAAALETAKMTADTKNERAKDRFLETLGGSGKGESANVEKYAEALKLFLDQNGYTVHTAGKLEDLVEKLTAEIEAFSEDVNSVLTESNSITEIEIQTD